jgi:hypothetical protein
MFTYPKQAEFSRVVPKTKIFAHARVGRRLKDLFAAQVDQIVWKYKLAPETVNLPAKDGIREIQVFELSLKTEELHEDILTTLDKAIPFPLLFQLVRADRIQYAATFKRPSEADATKWVIEAVFRTGWQPIDAERQPLPVCLDLAALHAQLVRQHLPLPARPGENLRDQVARLAAIQAKEKQCQQLENRLKQEKQFNRKVELNASLRQAQQELFDLRRLS